MARSGAKGDAGFACSVLWIVGATLTACFACRHAQAVGPAAANNASAAAPRQIDESRMRAAGIRKLSSRRLTLFTDLPSEKSVDELPDIFDQAFPQWCDYFRIDPRQHEDWHITAYLMKDKLRFAAAGVLPDYLPAFIEGRGYTRQDECWVWEQSSPYYRRHLLLHEGTHAFMYTLLGNVGPPWYAEGIAELMGTHRWADGRLTLNYFPKHPQEVPKLGRIEIVQTEFAARRAVRLADILNYPPGSFRNDEPYAWSWAAAAFLDNHPRYRERFRTLAKFVGDPDFKHRFAETFSRDGTQLAEEWQVFASDIAYGYDFKRTELDFRPGTALPPLGATLAVAGDRGWQNSGVRLEAGKTYQLRATGQFQVGKDSPLDNLIPPRRQPRPWISEAGGVSIHFNHGQPLGILLAAIRPDGAAITTSPLVMPDVVGLAATVRPTHSGTLYLRTNISDGDLDNAAGLLSVAVAPR
ncbi:MAG TPA: hypothetical protein VHX65_11810 [Pirellulales bacterium]|nr:hypothetical protein [Pirellulales bacterium]